MSRLSLVDVPEPAEVNAPVPTVVDAHVPAKVTVPEPVTMVTYFVKFAWHCPRTLLFYPAYILNFEVRKNEKK